MKNEIANPEQSEDNAHQYDKRLCESVHSSRSREGDSKHD